MLLPDTTTSGGLDELCFVGGTGLDCSAKGLLLTQSAFREEFRAKHTTKERRVHDGHHFGRLSARPRESTSQEAVALAATASAERPVELGRLRQALLHVPAPAAAERPAPLVVALHGAGGRAARMLAELRPMADRYGFLLLAPQSRRQSWDVIAGGYGPDVELLDDALEQVFRRYPVSSSRVAVGGFSDGASYALSLGIANGDVFSHVLAYSPGFAAPETQNGTPRFFVSHGTSDEVLPVDRCSRTLVPRLTGAGYDVTYVEFDGPHVMPPDVVDQSMRWFLDSGIEG